MTRTTREKPSVLLLHGLGGTGETLAPLANAIAAQGFTVAHPTLAEADRRAAASGCKAQLTVTLDDLLDEAREHAVRLAEGGTSPIICGHSNGALLAQTLASEDLASALCLMAPVPPPSVSTGVPVWLQELFFAASFGPRWRNGTLRFVRPRLLDPDPPPGEIAETLLPDSGPALVQAVRLADGCKFDPEPPLGVPVAVIAGRSDRIVPPDTARKVADHFGAEFHLVADGGHWLPAERRFSDRLAGLIAQFNERTVDRTEQERVT